MLLQIPGLGNQGVKKILNNNSLLLDDLDYLSFYVKKKFSYNLIELNERVNKLKDICNELNVDIILNNKVKIPDYPLILFLSGNKKLFEKDRIISVAGTRSPGRLGIQLCEEFTCSVIRNGGTVVTGFARGCDLIAHKTAIRMGGATIAVLPMGFNNGLKKILEAGNILFVSEYEPLSDIRRYRCVNRNRIIAGLSKALFVPEIGLAGGTYHTLKYANILGIPTAYGAGDLDITRFKPIKLNKFHEFDLYIKKSLQ